MPNKFEDLAENAHQLTKDQFSEKFSSLTRLTDDDTSKIINDTGISHSDLAEVLKVVKSDTQTNEKQATDIKNISKGVETLISIAKKVL